MTRYEKTKAAISAAIQAADPNAKVYDRWRYPKDTTYEGWLNLLGVGSKIQGWLFSRTGVPQSVNIEDTGGSTPVVYEQETWLINGWRTLSDNPPTEYDFQNTVDAVKSQLREHSQIKQLLVGPSPGVVDTIRVDDISEAEFGGERYAHRAQLTVTFTFPRTLA